MDSDSAKASFESMRDDPECIHVSNDPNLTGPRGESSVAAEEGGGCDGATGAKGIDAVDTAAAVLNPVAEMSGVVDAVSADLAVEGGGGGEENASFVAQECGSLDLVGGGAAVEVVPPVVGEGGEEDRAAEQSDSAANLLGLGSEKVSISGDNLEESKEEEPPASEVNGDDSLREGSQEVVCGGKADEKSSQAIESKLDVMEEDTAAQAASLEDIVSVDIDIPDAKDVASVAGFTEISSQDKDVASVASVDSVPLEQELLKELQIGEEARDLTDGDAKEDMDVTEGAMGNQLLKKTEEEEKPVLEIKTNPQDVDDVANEGSEKNETRVGESSVDKETVMDDVKENVEKDPEAGKSVDMHVPESAEEVETYVKYGDGIEEDGEGMAGVGEAEQTVDLEETQKLSEELAKVDETKIAEASEETGTVIRHEDEEKMDDMTDMAEDVKIHGDSSTADIEGGREDLEEMGVTEELEETVTDKVEGAKIDGVSEETETRIEDEDQEKDDDMADVKTHGDSLVADIEEGKEIQEEMGLAEMTETQEETVEGKAVRTKVAEASEETETRSVDVDHEKDENMMDVKTLGDSSVADTEEEKKRQEEMGMAEMTEMTETQEETVEGKVDGTKAAEMSEETEARTEDEDEEKDENMTDAETHVDSSLADIEEGKESQEEIEMTELTATQDESVTAETGDEDAEDVEEENKGVGGKRKRVRNTKTGKKKEEDVCFICFDGGDLVLCDRRGCPKAYHPSCVNQDEDFFRSKGKWNCGWHQCSKCEKTATYLCYTCVFSLCKGCAKDAVFFCIRGNKGFCETCMETIKLIEREEQEKKEPAQLDFDDKTSWESLFKDYWIDLKTQLSISPEELDQAKSPQKGNKSHAGKQGTAREIDYVTDEGSDSDSSPKKRKTRSRSKPGSAEKNQSPANKSSSGETWASKELLDVVAHMRRGDRSFLPSTEVHALLLDYIKKYNLRDPRRKSQVVCDSRLKNLFGKSHVGHFEMLNILDTHFLDKEQQQADNIQGSIVDTDPDYVDLDENVDHPVKSAKDKKRKTRKKGARKGRQSNLDDFAAVDMHNINLIYLRRSLVEDLLEDSTAFEEKVASAFVRLRISGNQKQDLYRLVQVVGTSKAPEPYKVGKKTTDYVLEILNLDKTEVISIDIISNQDFTEDECNRLRQSIKCGLINRLTVGDIQEKAIALQEVRVKNLLDAEILRFSHLRDRASDMGHRKELRECVEKVQLLKSPEERQRRLEEIPEIHADPKMDPDYESEDEEEKEKEKSLRRRSSSFNRRGRDPISPRKGGFSSNESWTGTSNYSSTSANRELSRSYSGRGSNGRGDYLGSSDDKVSDSLWNSGREREKDMQQYLGTEKPRTVSLPEPPPRSSRAVAPPELSPRIAPVISTPPPPVVPQPAPKSNESEKMWHYKDPSGKVQGPFSMAQLRKWNNTGYFPAKLEIWKANESSLDSVLLTDALAGLFQKQGQSVDNSYTKAYSGQSSQSEPNIGSSARTAPSVLDIPKNSQDTWSSGGSLPSPTPTQMTTPTAKRRSFESRWSPTKPSAQSAVQSMSFPSAQSVPSQASRTDIPVVVNTASALQPGTHPIPTPDRANVSVNHYGSSGPLPSPTPVGGMQSWGNMQTDKFDLHGRGRGDAPFSSQNSSASYGTTTPSALTSQSQPGFPASDPWRAPVPSQSNTQTQAPAWAMNTSQNSGQPQAPTNQNSSWGQATVVNPNMGWAGPPQAGMSVNWAASSVPPTGQGMPNPGWGGPAQVQQPQAYPNSGWGVTGQAQSQAQVQAPGSSTSSGWMQTGQGMQSGNSNQNWGTQNQTAMPSGGSGGNQTGYWGNQQNQNGDSGYGWNRQSSGSGGHNNNFKGQRVCKFHRENGNCRKGAACTYLHN
ncbi:zinc finger CCCH domain-containing protein 19-like [Brassica napus]|uniref:zinc finger CCCH domain-containing protein 19-like n=1 Tax=Brassica napus TaxID=3708 RepID=UPI002078B6F3|nr:zinc finger CCCH domain-containing protein 19-like [Brassica napus]